MIGLCASPNGALSAEVAFAVGDASGGNGAAGTRQTARMSLSGPTPTAELAVRSSTALQPRRASVPTADADAAVRALCARAAARLPRPALLDVCWQMQADVVGARRVLTMLEEQARTQQRRGDAEEQVSLAMLRACNLLRRQLGTHEGADAERQRDAVCLRDNEVLLRRCWARVSLRRS